jgi:hypothetical protein
MTSAMRQTWMPTPQPSAGARGRYRWRYRCVNLDIQHNDKYNFVYIDATAQELYYNDRPLSLLGLCFDSSEVRLVLQFQGDDNWSSTWCSLLKLYDQSSGDMAVVIKALVLRWRALQKGTPADTGGSNDVRQKENKERE